MSCDLGGLQLKRLGRAINLRRPAGWQTAINKSVFNLSESRLSATSDQALVVWNDSSRRALGNDVRTVRVNLSNVQTGTGLYTTEVDPNGNAANPGIRPLAPGFQSMLVRVPEGQRYRTLLLYLQASGPVQRLNRRWLLDDLLTPPSFSYPSSGLNVDGGFETTGATQVFTRATVLLADVEVGTSAVSTDGGFQLTLTGPLTVSQHSLTAYAVDGVGAQSARSPPMLFTYGVAADAGSPSDAGRDFDAGMEADAGDPFDAGSGSAPDARTPKPRSMSVPPKLAECAQLWMDTPQTSVTLRYLTLSGDVPAALTVEAGQSRWNPRVQDKGVVAFVDSLGRNRAGGQRRGAVPCSRILNWVSSFTCEPDLGRCDCFGHSIEGVSTAPTLSTPRSFPLYLTTPLLVALSRRRRVYG